MAARRKLRPGSADDVVELTHDGEPVLARRGEPIAVALIGADRLLLARSPKLHRPRGPYCLRGACDGCLLRVDGVPNVTTCLVSARGGERIETQNVLGTRGVDLLRATDFLFPHGFDHHRLLAGVRGVSAITARFARRVAGLGRLPDAAAEPNAAQRRRLDVLLIGGGEAGLVAAAALGARFPPRGDGGVLLVDDALALGGSLGVLDPEAASARARAVTASGAQLASATTAIGVFREPLDGGGPLRVLLASASGVTLVETERVVVATGAHAATAEFGNNDLPGVMSARAGLALLRHGITLGARVALLGAGRFATRFAELTEGVETPIIDPATIVRASGLGRVKTVVVKDGQRERKLRVDALLVDGVGAASIELAVQAGASVRFDETRGYVAERAADGSVAPGVWLCGSAAAASEPSARDAERVAAAVANVA